MNFIKNAISFFVLTLFISINAQANGFLSNISSIAGSNVPLDPSEAFSFSHTQDSSGTVFLNWNIKEGYYLYKNKIIIDDENSINIVDINYSESETKEDPLFGTTEVYHDFAEVSFSAKAASTDDITISLSYQGCWEGGICYPPQNQEISIKTVTSLVSKVDEKALQQQSFSPKGENTKLPEMEQDKYLSAFKNYNSLTILGIFFLAGLALSLTPCVFPMIPILSGIIAGQGKDVSTKNSFVLSLIYVLAMSLTYTSAGVLAGIFGANIQASLQSAPIIIIFSLIFVGLSLSMFGFYDLQMPSSIQTWLMKNSDKQKGGTYTGVAIMGFLSALIVGPCMAAPLAGALMYIGQTGDPAMGGSALFALSIGMGVPLILIGTTAGKLLPKAGPWMEGVKSFFGVSLLLMAVLMLDRIVDTSITMAMTSMILIISSVFMGIFQFNDKNTHYIKNLTKGIGLIIFIYGVTLLVGTLSGNKSLIYPLKNVYADNSSLTVEKNNFITVSTAQELSNILESSKISGAPALLDYYADWCVSCKEVEHILEDKDVVSSLKGFTLIKVDVTKGDDESNELQKKHEVLGPPALIFYNNEGTYMKSLKIVGVPSKNNLLTAIEITKGN